MSLILLFLSVKKIDFVEYYIMMHKLDSNSIRNHGNKRQNSQELGERILD